MDEINGDLTGSIFHKLVDHLSGKFEGNSFAVSGRLGNKRNECTFEFTNIRRDVVGQIINYFLRHFDTVGVDFLLKDCDACFEIRHLKIGRKAPLKAREKALLKSNKFNRRFIRG